MRDLEELSYATCRGPLASGVIGRVAVITADGPRIVTVNHSVVDEAIVFRTSPDSLLGRHASGAQLAFQVDCVDYAAQRAWSVQATGSGELVDDPDEVAHIRHVWPPMPWAGGARPLLVKLVWEELSGRQLGLGADPKSQLRGPTGIAAPPLTTAVWG